MVDTTRTHDARKRKPLDATSCWASARPPQISGATPDEIVAVLAVLDAEGGVSTIGDLAGAIPASTRPVSVILALADAGVLELDLGAPFDAAMRVRRAR